MKVYFAPLEGLTDEAHRRIHHKYFPGIDRYYMPFLSPTQTHKLSPREERELPPCRKDFVAIPQFLTKSVEDFLWAAERCAERGYQEVNLNVGCPSGTVVAKGKGSGMLSDLESLARFFDEIFAHCPLTISVKTRLGMESAEEFPKILDCFNAYPISELTVHPRVRKQFYKGGVFMDAFRYALANSKAPVCYNGDLCTQSDLQKLGDTFPNLHAAMIGRGLIGNPSLLCGTPVRERIYQYHEELIEEYCRIFGNAHNAMCRMKEHWHMLISLFENSEKLGKQLRKCMNFEQFRAIATEILTQLPLLSDSQAAWRERTPF